jgi:Bacterial Ig-like domain
MGCANESSPQGGPKDTQAPRLAKRSIKDSMLQFTGGTISFEFDEKIDPSNITLETFPLMNPIPKPFVNKKMVSIAIADSLLQPNTTYKINFGNSIKDVYEGMPIDNLGFTFSTGLAIDSLQINGKVLKAKTGEPDSSATIVLYPTIQSDTDIMYKKPLYAAKVNSDGNFTITNLPNKEFYCYAITDANKNYKYDYPTEALAFLSTTIVPAAKPVAFTMRTFYEVPDTNVPKFNNRNSDNPGYKFSVNVDTSDTKKRSYDITEPITIASANKLLRWSSSRIRLYADSVLDETGIVSYDSIAKKIKIKIDLQQNKLYKLVLLDSFAADTNGVYKGNTYVFRTKTDADYGTLKLNYPIQQNSYAHILQLFVNDKKIASQTITDSITVFKLLNPGNYTLKIIHDVNGNGVWDNGKYKTEKLQPELVEKYRQDVVIKANWINSIDWVQAEKKK